MNISKIQEAAILAGCHFESGTKAFRLLHTCENIEKNLQGMPLTGKHTAPEATGVINITDISSFFHFLEKLVVTHENF